MKTQEMKEITLPTNLHCGSCVTKLGKVLDNTPKVHHWSADVSKHDKPVTIVGDLNESEATALIEQAGFKTAYGIPTSCTMHAAPAAKELTPPKGEGFWRDVKVWRRAGFNTLNCLIGCSIGDFAMIIYLQVYHPGTPMWLQMMLAIIAGLITSIALETTILHLREKLVWKAALQMALSMSLISMVGMEVVMNTTDFMITGGKAQLSSMAYWLAFLPAALAGFLAPLPYNYYQLKKHNKACH
jgi:cation transport ATPase